MRVVAALLDEISHLRDVPRGSVSPQNYQDLEANEGRCKVGQAPSK